MSDRSCLANPATSGSRPRALAKDSSAWARWRTVSGSRGKISRWCSRALVIAMKAPWSSRRSFTINRSIRVTARRAFSSMSGRSSTMSGRIPESGPENHRCELLRMRCAKEINEEFHRVDASLTRGAQDSGENRLRSRPALRPVATAGHLSIHDRRPDGLLAVEIGRFQLRVIEEAEDRAPMVDDVPGKLAVLVVGEVLGDQLVETPFELACPIDEPSAREIAHIDFIPQEQGVVKQSLEIAREAHAARPVEGLQTPAAHDQVAETELVDCGLEPIVGRPAVPSQKAGVVSPQGSLDHVEAAARLDHVERDLFARAGKRPQPLQAPSDLPAGLVRVANGAIANDALNSLIERLRLLRRAQEGSQESRAVDREVEGVIEEPGDLPVGCARGLVELGGEGKRACHSSGRASGRASSDSSSALPWRTEPPGACSRAPPRRGACGARSSLARVPRCACRASGSDGIGRASRLFLHLSW